MTARDRRRATEAGARDDRRRWDGSRPPPSVVFPPSLAPPTGFSHTFGPRGLVEMGRAFLKGHRFESTEGNLPQHAGGFFVDRGGTVRLVHRNRTIGDHLPPQAILDVALADFARTQTQGG